MTATATYNLTQGQGEVAKIAGENLVELSRSTARHIGQLLTENQRTADLQKLVNAMAGREVRMAELKDVIRELRAQLKDAGLTPVADDPLLGEM